MAGIPSGPDGPFLEPFPNVLPEELLSPSGSILDPLGRVFGPPWTRPLFQRGPERHSYRFGYPFGCSKHVQRPFFIDFGTPQGDISHVLGPPWVT